MAKTRIQVGQEPLPSNLMQAEIPQLPQFRGRGPSGARSEEGFGALGLGMENAANSISQAMIYKAQMKEMKRQRSEGFDYMRGRDTANLLADTMQSDIYAYGEALRTLSAHRAALQAQKQGLQDRLLSHAETKSKLRNADNARSVDALLSMAAQTAQAKVPEPWQLIKEAFLSIYKDASSPDRMSTSKTLKKQGAALTDDLLGQHVSALTGSAKIADPFGAGRKDYLSASYAGMTGILDPKKLGSFFGDDTVPTTAYSGQSLKDYGMDEHVGVPLYHAYDLLAQDANLIAADPEEIKTSGLGPNALSRSLAVTGKARDSARAGIAKTLSDVTFRAKAEEQLRKVFGQGASIDKLSNPDTLAKLPDKMRNFIALGSPEPTGVQRVAELGANMILPGMSARDMTTMGGDVTLNTKIAETFPELSRFAELSYLDQGLTELTDDKLKNPNTGVTQAGLFSSNWLKELGKGLGPLATQAHARARMIPGTESFTAQDHAVEDWASPQFQSGVKAMAQSGQGSGDTALDALRFKMFTTAWATARDPVTRQDLQQREPGLYGSMVAYSNPEFADFREELSQLERIPDAGAKREAGRALYNKMRMRGLEQNYGRLNDPNLPDYVKSAFQTYKEQQAADKERASKKASVDETSFKKAYGDVVSKRNAMGMPLNPNPDDPAHKYDYRKAFAAGKLQIDSAGHFPSGFKAGDHDNRFVDGVDTITGEPSISTTALLDKIYAGAGLDLIPPNALADIVRSESSGFEIEDAIKGQDEETKRTLQSIAAQSKKLDADMGSLKPPAWTLTPEMEGRIDGSYGKGMTDLLRARYTGATNYLSTMAGSLTPPQPSQAEQPQQLPMLNSSTPGGGGAKKPQQPQSSGGMGGGVWGASSAPPGVVPPPTPMGNENHG